MKTREALTEAFEERADYLKTRAKALLNGKLDKARIGMPPTLPAYAEVYANEYGNVYVFVANDPTKLNYVRDRFRKFGWEVGDFEDSSWGSHSAEASLPNPDSTHSWESTINEVSICAMDSREGATCKTVKIGKTLQEIDVWETRCTEEDES